MKLSGTQLFVLAVVGLLILAGVAYLDRTYIPILVTAVLTVLGVAVHINGVNTGVPLSPPATANPTPSPGGPPA